MAILGVAFGKVAARTFRQPFRDVGERGEGVDFSGFSFLDFHFCFMFRDQRLSLMLLGKLLSCAVISMSLAHRQSVAAIIVTILIVIFMVE